MEDTTTGPVAYCINFNWHTGEFDGSGNAGCVDKFMGLYNMFFVEEGMNDGITTSWCYDNYDEEMENVCSMITEECDYDYDGILTWCELVQCSAEAGEYFGCAGLCDELDLAIDHTPEEMDFDFHLHHFCYIEAPMTEFCFCDESGINSVCT